MSRKVVGALAALLVITAVLAARQGGGSTEQRVDVIFDTAKGIVPGQVVKVAGSRVGTVRAVELVSGPAARLELDVDRRLAFRADASCRILPEGLISENYVDCEPGTATAEALPRSPGTGVPTVARGRTQVPVSVQDMIEVFAAPTNQRLRVMLGELGIATAGRGGDLNAMLRRSNPALSQAQAVLSVLNRQNRVIVDAVAQTDQVLAAVQRDRGAVRRFVGGAAAVSQRLAPVSPSLARAVREFPRTLQVTETTMKRVRRLTSSARPLLRDVRTATPALDRLSDSLPAFTDRGLRTLRTLSPVLQDARPTLRRALAVTRAFGRLTPPARKMVPLLRDLLVSTRDTGGFEGLLNLGYTLAAMSSGYDSVSHMAGVFIGLAPNCIVANVTDPGGARSRLPDGCDHRYLAAGRGTVPVNAPSAGPQDGWDTALSGARAPGGPARNTAPSLDRRGAQTLLDYLLP